MTATTATVHAPRPRAGRHRFARFGAKVSAYVPAHEYIPAGVADLWKSARPRFSR
jgi:hypothetical protein